MRQPPRPREGKVFPGPQKQCSRPHRRSSELQRMYYGQTEKAIRDLFENLDAFAAAVLVLDEFEALAWRRDRMQGSHESSQAAVVGQLLTTMDGLRSGKSRVVEGVLPERDSQSLHAWNQVNKNECKGTPRVDNGATAPGNRNGNGNAMDSVACAIGDGPYGLCPHGPPEGEGGFRRTELQ